MTEAPKCFVGMPCGYCYWSFSLSLSLKHPDTVDARMLFDDASGTYQHRLQRLQHSESTQASAFVALKEVIDPAVSP